MNIYGIIILAAILFDYLLNIAADILNLRNLKSPLSGEFSDLYSNEKYEKSQRYTIVKTRFGFIVESFSLAVLLIFWFSGGFNYLDNQVRLWSDGLIRQGLLFIGVIIFLQAIISLPFSIYSIFVIEEKFGFNKTTVKTFISDLLKSLLLSVLIGAPVLVLILYLLDNTGPYAWIYGWAGVTFISLLIQYIAPTWIMPLFNKFTPLEDGELRNTIMAYAEKVKFPLRNLYVMDGSKRSTKSNAFFTGFGKNKRIALFDTLIAKHTINELKAVLAHEIGHYKKKHILKGSIISIIHFGFMFYLLSLFLTNGVLFEAFYMDKISIYAGLLFFGMLYSPVEQIISILMSIYSRKNEYEADRFAAETTEDRESMVSALKKLSVDNLSNLTPHPFYVFINYSHPPLPERIKAIRGI